MTSRAEALTIAQVLDQPALVPLWPTVAQALGGLAESTVYQLAAENRLPFEVIRLGRRRYVRTVDLHAFLGLRPGNGGRDGTPVPEPPPKVSGPLPASSAIGAPTNT